MMVGGAYTPAYTENVNLEGVSILVVGSQACLAKHLIRQLHDCKAIVKTLDISKNLECGTAFDANEVEDAVNDIDTCVLLQDYKDFNMYPNVSAMDKINVKGTEQVVSACCKSGVKRVLLASSVFVMTSNTWPSVMNPETAKIPPPDQMPFPEYAQSRMQAEAIVKNLTDSMQSMIMRLTPIYGEDDDGDSFMMKALKLAQDRNGHLPVLGDKGGVLQHAYAGNVAWGFIKGIQKMIDDPSSTKEVLFVLDDTPREGVYQLLEPFLTARGYRMGWGLPFWFLYIPLLAFEKVMKRLGNWLWTEQPPWPVSALPSANYLYIFFYHWIYFQGVKARVYLNYIPPFSHQQAIQNSAQYYSKCVL